MIAPSEFLKWLLIFGVPTGGTLPVTLPLSMANGGSGASLVPVEGSLIVSGTSAMGLLAPVPERVLVSDLAGLPVWDTTLPAGLTAIGMMFTDTVDMGNNAIVNLLAPVNDTDAATKLYVDQVAAGLAPAGPVDAATTTNFVATYNNGASGVGATLTANAAGAVTFDGVAVTLNQDYLFKNQSNAYENGIYICTTLGTVSVPAVFTRSINYDQPTDINNTGLVPVINGTTQANTGWYQVNTITTVGVDALTFIRFGNTGTVTSVTAGTGLTGGVITTTGTISLADSVNLRLLANISGGVAAPVPNTLTAILDAIMGSAVGDLLCRGVSGWQVITAGSAGQVFTANGVGAIPSFQSYVAVDKVCQGRLTLGSNVPVTTTNITGANTLYFTPYKGDEIDLYTGGAWQRYVFTQLSIAVPATATTAYDVWIYSNAGVPTIELLAWTNSSTRATALNTQNGVYVKDGDPTRRYVGSVYVAVSGQLTDSDSSRFVWNYYNRVNRPLSCSDNTNSWTYSSSTIRQANGNTANQVNYMIGVPEDTVHGMLVVSAQANSLATNAMCGIGVNSTTVNSAQTNMGAQQVVNTGSVAVSASYNGNPSTGVSYMAWLESNRTNANTVTWFGDNNDPTVIRSGLSAEIWG